MSIENFNITKQETNGFDITVKSFRNSLVLCFVSSKEPGPFPGIVDIYGAGGGLPEYRASLLAGKGFAVMALAYYNYEDLPKGMENIHLEYFEEAVNYLLNHPQVGIFLSFVVYISGVLFINALGFQELDKFMTATPYPNTLLFIVTSHRQFLCNYVLL